MTRSNTAVKSSPAMTKLAAARAEFEQRKAAKKTAKAPAKAKVKPTVVTEFADLSPEAQAELVRTRPIGSTEAEAQTFFDYLSQGFTKFGVKMPSTTRIVLAYLCAAITGGAIGWVGGMLIEYLIAATIALPGAAFIAAVIYILGIALTMVAAYFAGGYVGDFVLEFSLARMNQRRTQAVAKVRSWFSRGDAKVVDAKVAVA